MNLELTGISFWPGIFLLVFYAVKDKDYFPFSIYHGKFLGP